MKETGTEILINLFEDFVIAGVMVGALIGGIHAYVEWRMKKYKFHSDLVTKSIDESKTWGELFERWEQDRKTTLEKFKGKWWYYKCNFEKYHK